MQKLITSLVLLAVVAFAVGDWAVRVTFSDDCVTPVAAQFVSHDYYQNISTNAMHGLGFWAFLQSKEI